MCSILKGQQCKKNSFFDCLTFGTNHQPSPHNIAEERKTQLLRGGSLILAYYKRFHKNRGLWISYTGLVIVSRRDKHSYLHGSFVNAVGIGDYVYIASHAKTVNMNWKGCWKKWSWPSWWCYQEISTERLRKTKIIKGLFQPTFELGTSRIQLWKFTFRITVLGNDQRDAHFFSMCLFLFWTLYMFRAHRAHHQERQIVSIQSLIAVTLCRRPCGVQAGSSLPTCTPHGHRHRVTVIRDCIDTICLSWWWARCARNM
jgi:hypothetical protein